MTEMVTSGSMSGEGKRSDGLLGEGGNERRCLLQAPPVLYATALLLDSTEPKKTADIVTLIEFLLAYDTAGDPITGVKWSRRTTAKVALALGDFGIDVSPNTVARLLRQMGYALRVNHKQLPPDASPDRNQQFLYIRDLLT